MKNACRKRIVSVVLASVLAVGNICNADEYKNTILALKLENTNSNNVNITLKTKTEYDRTINVFKLNPTTYVISLPEIDSKISQMPKIEGNIQGIDVKTLPYTPTGKGYTKITVKTVSNTNLQAKSTIYVEESGEQNKQNSETNQQANKNIENNTNSEEILNANQQDDVPKQETQEKIEENPNTSVEEKKEPADYEPPKEKYPNTQHNQLSSQDNSYTIFLFAMGVLLIIIVGIYSYIKGKEKIAELTGEQGNYSVEEEKPKKEKIEEENKKKRIKETIQALDKKYTQPVKMPVSSDFPNSEPEKTSPKELSEDIVLDLDALFNDISKSNAEQSDEKFSNNALEEFLNTFAEDEEKSEIIQEENTYDKEFLEKFLSQDKIEFLPQDIDIINKLMVEISDDTLQNIDKYAKIAREKNEHVSKKEILEHFVSTYTVDCHVSFTEEDINALNKLINVELDKDFVTDLRTNPQRTEEIRQEIEEKRPNKKIDEIKTLNVENMPDMAQEVKKYEGEYIESDAKPEIINYSENFELSQINVKEELPDIEKEKNNKNAYKSRPSDKYEVLVSGYDVAKISVAGQLPDLQDVLAHPQKYEKSEEKPAEADEKTLLQNLSNVKFKPFYEDKKIINSSEPDDEKDFAEFFSKEKSVKNNKKPLVQKKTTISTISANKTTPKNCVVDGVEYDVISASSINDKYACYLVKDGSGYCVIGFNGKTTQKIKSYENLMSEKIQARIEEKLPDNILRCLVKIGLNKFIMKFSDNSMEYVMDLC